MKNTLIFLAGLLLVGCNNITLDQCAPCEERSERFLDQVAKGNTLKAYETLGTATLEGQAELQSLIGGTNKLLRSKGMAYEMEKLDFEFLGKRISKHRYLLHHKEGATLWVLKYYKSPTNDEQWIVNGISVEAI
ncbi:MAG: hypothetical protein ACQES2_11285 [Pseudomonadota bacterium]